MGMKLVKGRDRSWTRKNLSVEIADGDTLKKIRLDCEFRIMDGDEWADVVSRFATVQDIEICREVVRKVEAPSVDIVDENDQPLSEDEATALLISQREISRILAAEYYEYMKATPADRKRKN